MSGLRDSAGLYSYPALNDLVGQNEADRTLCHYHHQIFRQWIACTLAEQKADLDDYGDSSRHVLDLAFGRGLIPQGAHEVECLLYVTDLEMLLELLRLECGGAFGNRGA